MPNTDDLASRSSRSALVVAGLGTMLALIAFTAPLSTLNATAEALGSGVAGRTWILSSMSIGLGAALLSTGTIADDFGRRRIFIIGMAVLALGSVTCALAPHVLIFVLARVVQGLGGAAVIASSLGIIAHAFAAGPARATASGVWGASLGAGIALGPLLSAGSDKLASWRDAYWVLGAAAILIALAARLVVDESNADEPRGLDLVGAVFLAAGMSSLLATLVEGRQGWTQPIVIVLAVATAILLSLFLIVESHSDSSMLDLALLRQPAFAAATAAAFATGAGCIALFSYMPGFLGATLGISALGSACLLFAWSATSVVTALLSRHIPAGVSGRVQLAFGLFGVAIGQLSLTAVSENSSWLKFLPGLLFAGVASGVLNAALGREAVASVPPGRGGMGSGANNTSRYVGSAIGVTVVAVIAARPGPGSPTVDLISGWNIAAIVTAVISVAGGLVVLACGPRRHGASPLPPL